MQFFRYMKKIFYLLISISLVSCYKYAEQTTPTLSGEYIIDKITLTETESTGNPKDSVYYPGDVFIDPTSLFPLDSISIGVTRWHFDYMQVAFCPTPTPWGTFEWSEKYFYDLSTEIKATVVFLEKVTFEVNVYLQVGPLLGVTVTE